ncbi:MAG TPA: hypothetical protein VGD57_05080 [Candidatus Dormibacteraeota bacterium]
MSPPAVAAGVANALTRVPAGSPPLDATQMRLLPVADVVMLLMFSRPGGLSLRNTWVTPATIWLCSAVSATALVLGLAACSYGLGTGYLLPLVGGLVALIGATGCASVAVYGARQRLLAGR